MKDENYRQSDCYLALRGLIDKLSLEVALVEQKSLSREALLNGGIQELSDEIEELKGDVLNIETSGGLLNEDIYNLSNQLKEDRKDLRDLEDQFIILRSKVSAASEGLKKEEKSNSHSRKFIEGKFFPGYRDKYKHVRGPWDDEPDQKIWIHKETGYTCVAWRYPEHGFWRGYVSIPRNHPGHGRYIYTGTCVVVCGDSVRYNLFRLKEKHNLTHFGTLDGLDMRDDWYVGFNYGDYDFFKPGLWSDYGADPRRYAHLSMCEDKIKSLAIDLKDMEERLNHV